MSLPGAPHYAGLFAVGAWRISRQANPAHRHPRFLRCPDCLPAVSRSDRSGVPGAAICTARAVHRLLRGYVLFLIDKGSQPVTGAGCPGRHAARCAHVSRHAGALSIKTIGPASDRGIPSGRESACGYTPRNNMGPPCNRHLLLRCIRPPKPACLSARAPSRPAGHQ